MAVAICVGMRADDLKARTKKFAVEVIKLVTELPRSLVAEALGRQLVKCGTSVGAQYRAACRAKSRADFISKMGNVEEEADESAYWMELLVEARLVSRQRIEWLLNEAGEYTAISVSSIRTARHR